MADYKIISADSHCEEPEELYEQLSPEYRERAPHIEKRGDGVYMIQEGQIPVRVDLMTKRLTEEDKRLEFRGGSDEPTAYGNESAIGANVAQRLADLEEDGITSEVIYPQGLFKVFASPDPGYQLAFARMYNDWYGEVFNEYPDRFIPSAVIPMININEAIVEAERVVKLGFRSVSLPIAMPHLPYNRPEYEPFWAAIEEMSVPISFHTLTRGENPRVLGEGEEDSYGADFIFINLGMAEAMSPLCMLVGSGVLQRHPQLKFVLVECGTGWLAWFLNSMDEMYHKRHMWHRPKLELAPSEFFKRQGHITFSDDEIGLRNRDVTGVDCLMWGSDYPHDEGTFPHSREVVARIFKDISEEETRKIAGENAARLYNLSLN